MLAYTLTTVYDANPPASEKASEQIELMRKKDAEKLQMQTRKVIEESEAAAAAAVDLGTFKVSTAYIHKHTRRYGCVLRLLLLFWRCSQLLLYDDVHVRACLKILTARKDKTMQAVDMILTRFVVRMSRCSGNTIFGGV